MQGRTRLDNMLELTVKGFPTSCRLLSVFNWVSVWRVEGRSVSWLKLRSRERRESLVCVCVHVRWGIGKGRDEKGKKKGEGRYTLSTRWVAGTGVYTKYTMGGRYTLSTRWVAGIH